MVSLLMLGFNISPQQLRFGLHISDALLPCGPCSRSHAHSLKVNPTVTPPDPDCTYDNPDEVAEGPKGKIARLENRIGMLPVELEAIVQQKDAELQSCTCKRTAALTPTQSTHGLTPSPIGTSFGDTSPLSTTETFDKRSGYALVPAAPHPDPPINLPEVADGGDILVSSFSITDLPGRIFTHPTAGPSQMTIHNWPLNIPPPDILHHLVETFFSSVPLATRLIHRPSFMANLQKVPTSPDFPYVRDTIIMHALSSLLTPL
ncbi:hypothetical protein FRC00_012373, partial [Tulasnella sp. 408]